MQLPRNLNKSQRCAFLDACDVSGMVYTRKQNFNQNIEIPTRKFAEEVHDRYFENNRLGSNFDRHQKNFHFRKVTLQEMEKQVRKYAADNPSRFKFQIQRSYLINKHVLPKR